jgi:type I restriction-modification system DNA methylase subunit
MPELAGFMLVNDSMSSNQSDSVEIRKEAIEANPVECIVAIPDQISSRN